jgi:xylulokinase
MALLLGIDIGTTSTIGILIDSDGEALALADRSTQLFSELPGWAEEDPEQWWRNTGTVIAPCCASRAASEARSRRSV